MTDPTLIAQQLRNRQIQVERKINQLITQNPDPFPFDRVDKGKKLFELIQKTLGSIESGDLIRAGMYIKELETTGLKLDL